MDNQNDTDDEYVDDYVPMRKKRHLYLAFDNDPEYHGRPSAKELEELKEKKVRKSVSTKKKAGKGKVQNPKNEETSEHDNDEAEDKPDQKLFFYRYGVIGALTVGVLMGFGLRKYTMEKNVEAHSPNQVVPLHRDLDNDGVLDAYVELHNGHKIPLYGLRDGSGNSIKYITAEEINKISLKGRTYYESIENYLNNPRSEELDH